MDTEMQREREKSKRETGRCPEKGEQKGQPRERGGKRGPRYPFLLGPLIPCGACWTRPERKTGVSHPGAPPPVRSHRRASRWLPPRPFFFPIKWIDVKSPLSSFGVSLQSVSLSFPFWSLLGALQVLDRGGAFRVLVPARLGRLLVLEANLIQRLTPPFLPPCFLHTAVYGSFSIDHTRFLHHPPLPCPYLRLFLRPRLLSTASTTPPPPLASIPPLPIASSRLPTSHWPSCPPPHFASASFPDFFSGRSKISPPLASQSPAPPDHRAIVGRRVPCAKDSLLRTQDPRGRHDLATLRVNTHSFRIQLHSIHILVPGVHQQTPPTLVQRDETSPIPPRSPGLRALARV